MDTEVKKCPLSDEMVKEICFRISTGETLRHVLTSDSKFPSVPTFYRYLIEFTDLQDAYSRAQENRTHFWADDLIAKAENCQIRDTNRLRLEIDVKKWLMSKLCTKYSDRVQTQITGKDNGPLVITWKGEPIPLGLEE
jgi:hypothetical protein